MIPDEVVEQVSQQADIVAIISEHVKLKKVGSVWRGPCPFHQGTNANFSVMPRGGYTCFVCGEKGSVFTFVQKRLGMSFVEAVKYVGAKAGIEVEEVNRRQEGPDPREPLWELQGTAAEWFRQQLWDAPAGAEARKYLAEREVSRETADRFGLGYAPRDPQAMRAHFAGLGLDDERLLAAGLLVQREEHPEPRPRFRDRLMFPILDASGHTVGFGGRLLGPGEPKYLNSSESDIFSKGKLLYNLGNARHAIRRDERVLLVEGYFDALRLVDVGIENVVAPMGTALTEQQAELLARYTKQAVILYDSDGPGQKATFRAADVMLTKGLEVRVVTLPEGEDPDTFARTHGRDGVLPLIEQAMDVFDRKVQLLQRGGWFNDLQHKRQALDRLLPTIRAASDPITRDLYLARAAEAAGVAREVLLQELHAMRRSSRTAYGARGTRGARGADARGSAGAASGGDGEWAGPGAPGGDWGGPGAPEVSAAALNTPYRSRVEQGNAEQTLIRVLLTQPVWQDLIVEELGKLEAEEPSAGSDPFVGSDAPRASGAEGGRANDPAGDEDSTDLDSDSPGVLRDPVYAAIYAAAMRHGAEADAEILTDGLDPLAIHVYETLRGEKDAVINAKQSIQDALRQLRGRSLAARIEELDAVLPLADSGEKDRLLVRKQQLIAERNALGLSRWGAVRGR